MITRRFTGWYQNARIASDTIVTPIASASTICAATGSRCNIATTSVSARVVMFAPMM